MLFFYFGEAKGLTLEGASEIEHIPHIISDMTNLIHQSQTHIH